MLQNASIHPTNDLAQGWTSESANSDGELNVLMTATSYPRNEDDWQGIFIQRMAQSLAELTQLSLWAPPGPLPENVRYVADESDQTWLTALSNAGGMAHLLRNHRLLALLKAIGLLNRVRKVCRRNQSESVFHVNWLQNALALSGTPTPALVTALGSDFRLLQVPGMVGMLRRIFKQRKTAICPNAEWMVPRLRELFGDLAMVQCVPFGVDHWWFEVDRIASPPVREWLVVMRITEEKMGPLFEWGRHVFNGRDQLHLFGPNQDKLKIPDWLNYHGTATPEELARDWYPRAAGMITLSQHAEGRPQVMLEAMAAGLPIVASDIEAHRDLLMHGQNGLLVDSLQSLGDAIVMLGDSSRNWEMGACAKRYVAERFGTWQDCAARYVSIYRHLLV